ncbi:hypothetical protein Bhyg_09445, partial [Pseudolycoriella hygida]
LAKPYIETATSITVYLRDDFDVSGSDTFAKTIHHLKEQRAMFKLLMNTEAALSHISALYGKATHTDVTLSFDSSVSSSNMSLKIIFILITICDLTSSSDVLKHIYFNRIHSKVNPDYCPKHVSKLEFITRDLKSYTWICNLTKTVDAVNLHATLLYRYRNGYQKFLIDTNIDVCSYYKNTLGSGLMDLVRKEMEQYSTNVIHACPYTGEMSMVKIPLTGALFQYIFVPAGEYK